MKRYLRLFPLIIAAGILCTGCDLSDTDALVENGKEIIDNTFYNIGDVTVFDERFEILSGDVERRIITENPVNDISVTTAGCSFNIKDSGDDFCYIEGKEIEKLQIYEENGVAYVHALKNSNVTDSMEINLYIPFGKCFGKAEVDLGAGYVGIGSLVARDIELNVGAGSLDGNVFPTEGMKLNCDMGNISVTAAGNKEAYDYLVSVTAGAASIADEEFNGVSREFVDNKAGKKIELDVAVGNISLNFTE